MERLRRHERSGGDNSDQVHRGTSALLDTAGSTPVQQGQVEVISGASVQNLPLAGLQIAQARELVGTILHVDSHARVLVNGVVVSNEYRLAPNDVLEFVHHAGEKGGARLGIPH
jgi:hypothetical protein